MTKKYIERVSIVDKLPALTKIYEKFGREQPTRIDEKNKRIEWVFEKLEENEIRVLSYILYSKIGMVGKFALPPTTSIYEREGKIKETKSNNAYFVSEQKKKKLMKGNIKNPFAQNRLKVFIYEGNQLLLNKLQI